jgi:hypothetical protein
VGISPDDPQGLFEVFNEGQSNEARYRIPLTGLYLPTDPANGKGLAQQAFTMLMKGDAPTPGGGPNQTDPALNDATANHTFGANCGGRSYQIIITQSETITNTITIKNYGHDSSITVNNDLVVHVYLAAWPGFSCTLKMDSDGQGNYAYFYLQSNSDLTFDGNLTIDGQYTTKGLDRKNPLIYLDRPLWGSTQNSFTMAGNGVVLENNYNSIEPSQSNLKSGGAVGLASANDNIFTMEGGRITGNYSPGGAVYIYLNPSIAIFRMNGGTISGNYTDTGKQTPSQIFVMYYGNDYRPENTGVYWGPGSYGRVDGVIRATPITNPDPPDPQYLNGLPFFSPTPNSTLNVDFSCGGTTNYTNTCTAEKIEAFK